MRSEIIKRAEFRTAVWAGGTTEQIYIYPPDGSYSERNFLFRLSSAAVYDEQSVFTSLPGVERSLLLLDGDLTLIHGDNDEVKLSPGMQDSFPGGCRTVSRGKGRDLNLMTRENARGCLTCQRLFPKSGVELCHRGRGETPGFFLLLGLQGELELSAGAESMRLETGACAVFSWEAGEEGRTLSVLNRDTEAKDFALAEVWLTESR